MYRIPINFHKRLMRGEKPIAYAVIHTHLGYRAYAEKELAAVFEAAPRLLDGSWLLDGSATLGADSFGIIDKAARVLSFGSFEKTISPMKDDVITAYQGRQLQHMEIQLDNTDRYFSRLIPKEPFLGRSIEILVGFEAEPQHTHLQRFYGVISELSVLPVLTIEADER